MRLRFAQRTIEPELLDGAGVDEARASLNDLIRLNRDWGGYSSLAQLLDRADVTRGPASVLDVGAASGDMGRQFRALRPHAAVTSLDYVVHHLAKAPAPKIAADAFYLPFPPRSFDYVFASLFLHHFTGGQIVELLRAFGRTARRGVLISDLERRTIPYYFVPFTRWVLGWDPITVHDAPVSVAAGFRTSELRDLAIAAGLQPDVRTHGMAFRITMWAPTC